MSRYVSHHPTKQGIFHLQQIWGGDVKPIPKKGHSYQPLRNSTSFTTLSGMFHDFRSNFGGGFTEDLKDQDTECLAQRTE